MKYYTEDHEWVEIIGETALVGISQFASDLYGEVSFVDLPDEGDDLIIGDKLCSLESNEFVRTITHSGLNRSVITFFFI